MAIFKCKMCGGTLEINNNETVAVCEYCGTKQTLPKLDDEKRVQLYDRANHFRRENEFDKAMGIYEMILSDDKEDCESYWGLVLCRYGIEYVEDPRTHKRIPTVNRAQFTSIFDDDDYKNAIKYADGYQKDVYEAEASVIDKIQKGILEISNKEEPFDVFICYKETDSHGNRTQDSVYAQDIYTALTKEGYKVFFSRITLEDKLGSAYEPYIFAALNSAKVMLVVGTEKDNFNAVWVKNEWSRYISLIKAGKDKTLIPVYKDISPYDMPEEFQYLQSQDMGKIGFMQDLVRGISKIVDGNKVTVKEKVVINAIDSQIEPLLKRAFIYLEDGDFIHADEYCEKALDIDPENAQAYLGKLMVQYHIRNRNEFKNVTDMFDKSTNYKKAYKYADNNMKKELESYVNDCNLDRASYAFRKSRGCFIAVSAISLVLLVVSFFANLFFKNILLYEQKSVHCIFEIITVILMTVIAMLYMKKSENKKLFAISFLLISLIPIYPILSMALSPIGNNFIVILDEMLSYSGAWILPQIILYPLGILFIVISAFLVGKFNKYGFSYFSLIYLILLHVLQIGCIIFDFMYPNKVLATMATSLDLIIFIIYAVVNILLCVCMMVFIGNKKRVEIND